jgi:hypothetical protein
MTTITLVHTRAYADYAAFAAKLDRLQQTGRLRFDAVLAAGPHTLAARYARQRNLPLRILAPNHARDRGLARAVHRDELLAATTHLIAFHDGVSRTVGELIARARGRQLATVLVVPVVPGPATAS